MESQNFRMSETVKLDFCVSYQTAWPTGTHILTLRLLQQFIGKFKTAHLLPLLPMMPWVHVISIALTFNTDLPRFYNRTRINSLQHASHFWAYVKVLNILSFSSYHGITCINHGSYLYQVHQVLVKKQNPQALIFCSNSLTSTAVRNFKNHRSSSEVKRPDYLKVTLDLSFWMITALLLIAQLEYAQSTDSWKSLKVSWSPQSLLPSQRKHSSHSYPQKNRTNSWCTSPEVSSNSKGNQTFSSY